jgi:hypothetical protein
MICDAEAPLVLFAGRKPLCACMPCAFHPEPTSPCIDVLRHQTTRQLQIAGKGSKVMARLHIMALTAAAMPSACSRHYSHMRAMSSAMDPLAICSLTMICCAKSMVCSTSSQLATLQQQPRT